MTIRDEILEAAYMNCFDPALLAALISRLTFTVNGNQLKDDGYMDCYWGKPDDLDDIGVIDYECFGLLRIQENLISEDVIEAGPSSSVLFIE